jgi:hypothetical protein
MNRLAGLIGIALLAGSLTTGCTEATAPQPDTVSVAESALSDPGAFTLPSSSSGLWNDFSNYSFGNQIEILLDWQYLDYAAESPYQATLEDLVENNQTEATEALFNRYQELDPNDPYEITKRRRLLHIIGQLDDPSSESMLVSVITSPVPEEQFTIDAEDPHQTSSVEEEGTLRTVAVLLLADLVRKGISDQGVLLNAFSNQDDPTIRYALMHSLLSDGMDRSSLKQFAANQNAQTIVDILDRPPIELPGEEAMIAPSQNEDDGDTTTNAEYPEESQ